MNEETGFQLWLMVAKAGARYETDKADKANLCLAITCQLVRVEFGPAGVPVAIRLNNWPGETVP